MKRFAMLVLTLVALTGCKFETIVNPLEQPAAADTATQVVLPPFSIVGTVIAGVGFDFQEDLAIYTPANFDPDFTVTTTGVVQVVSTSKSRYQESNGTIWWKLQAVVHVNSIGNGQVTYTVRNSKNKSSSYSIQGILTGDKG